MTALLDVNDLSKSFKEHQGLFGSDTFHAVQDVSFSLARKQTLAIIGNNGSGKSTLAKMIVGITRPTSGQIVLDGKPLTFGDYQYRSKRIRMLMQDPNSAFNPRLNIGQILDMPLKLGTNLNEQQRNEKIFETLRLVGLYPDHTNVKIHTLSASQKQRIAFAQALILEPQIIITDDTIGTLDASVKTQLTNLMLNVQERRGVAYIYVSQHLGFVKHIADQVLVMDKGLVVEYGSTRNLFSHPKSDITKRLVESHFEHVLDDRAWEREW
ncbi:peptide ABC transporter ATP-binding protein [Lonepinella koalarum]|uniref:Cationic peptide transport system ATP-binding protein n=1 Tax=Lonepinella koalarum TaxID=53417 RepID=A0A4R1KYC2_9PAST|nr:ATP-binding cassette domain-containing protein [Lonepinella koalarum]MDH2926846.1 peptide ABC transporter ATP-binding protein [Lonepinella koalarum]TCK70495.1 cationic peptide transport system ATP-binding protein [Lonepinella koalarum]TFJ90122.1 ATP-binding cassette domain-containing protein [Lonepinella koalarum]